MHDENNRSSFNLTNTLFKDFHKPALDSIDTLSNS